MSRAASSVDVVVPTHTLERPVERAVASVLDDPRLDVRVVLVCHGLPVTDVLARVPARYHDRIDAQRHDDGIASPAGPFNAGYRAATATFVSPMSSDDHARPGALAAWLDRARRTRADVVVARVESPDGELVPTPPTRWGRRATGLDADRDRLFYRTVPQGLVRATLPARLGIEYTQGLASGEDIAFTTRLWTSGARVVFAREAPAYVLGDDVPDRVSLAPRPLRSDLEPIRLLCAQPWVQALPEPVRLALAAKLLRIHVLGTLGLHDAVTSDDVVAAADAIGHLVALAPHLREVLSLAEARLVAAVGRGAPGEELLALAAHRTRHGHPDTLRTRTAATLLHRQAPLRLMAASVLLGVA